MASEPFPADHPAARWRYECLLLEQPHIETGGLWYKDGEYFVVCPGLATGLIARDGTPIERWFDERSIVGEVPISIAGTVPPRATEVPPRTVTEIATGHGTARTTGDMNRDLALALPSEFPPFTARFALGTLVVTAERELDEAERSRFEKEVRNLGDDCAVVVQVEPRKRDKSHPNVARGVGDLTIRSSRSLASILPQKLKWQLEEDDDFWADNRSRILGSTEFSKASAVLPNAWATEEPTCLVNATSFAPLNIRNYLSLYRSVSIAAPLDSSMEANCAALGATSKELIELVALGRVRLVLPQPIDRYALGWLGEAAEASKTGLLFSRRLSAATILDARSRVPLLFPVAGLKERHELLHAFSTLAAQQIAPEPRAWLEGLIDALSRAWSLGDLLVHRQAAMATGCLGIGALTAAVSKRMRRIDQTLEIEHAGETVEWASALGATVCPVATASYSEVAASELVAAFYGGTTSKTLPTVTPEVHRLVGDLLVIDDDSPVVTFAKAFGSADIDRFRSLVAKLEREEVTPEDLAAAVKKFNESVRGYEARPDRVRTLGLISLGLAAANVAKVVTTATSPLFSLGAAVLSGLLVIGGEEFAHRNQIVGRLLDTANGALSGRGPAPVLVARIRKRMKAAK